MRQDGKFVRNLTAQYQLDDHATDINSGKSTLHSYDYGDDAPLYQSSHWDEPNVLAHVRFDDRTDADGNKVLMIHELQSDWGQAGLKHGFSDEFPKNVLDAAVKGGMDPKTAESDIRHLMADPIDTIERPTSEQWKRLGVATQGSGIDLNEVFHDRPAVGIPSAPFVGKTESWLQLGIKRMISYAAEHGYDKIAFANGQQNADHYDLSKTIEEVAYNKESNFLRVISKDGRVLVNGTKQIDELPDIIGKDLADKIDKDSSSFVRVTGLDLKVGGEGMKAFYDKIVPQNANKVLKDIGGGRVEPINIMQNEAEEGTPGAAWNSFRKSQAQPGFDITDAMRAKAEEGLPLFSRKQSDMSAIDHDADMPDELQRGYKAPGYSAYEGIIQPKRESSGTISDSITKAFAPAELDGARITSGIIRGNLGEQAHVREVAQQELMEFGEMFNHMTPEDNFKFIDAMERGKPLADPQQDRAAKALRKVLDQRRDQVIELGKGNLENFNENYFPHIWKDRVQAAQFFTRRPLEGGKGFLKQRTYDYFSDGIAAGLQPVTTNPVELAMVKAREMDRYIYAQKIFAEMKDTGQAKFVAFGAKAPDGWTKINDRIARVMQYSEEAKGMVLRGEYYAPDQAATLINNHLSPGLSGNRIYDIVRQSGNMLNAAQLGLSAFHLGFTTLDVCISKASLGIKQISRGDVGEGALNVLQSVNPLQPVFNVMKGDKLLKAYMGDITDPSMAPIVDALINAGGRVKMDDVYRNQGINEFRQALAQGNYGQAAMKFFPRLMDMVNKPIFEYLVPRQKLGVFFDMAQDALSKNPDMDTATKREVMGKLWDSVDNRMGELVYDNVFWNRSLKDALMVSTRSVGWNLGTFREIGGGVKDLKDIKKLGGLSDRSAYILGLTFISAIVGSLTQYLYTGQGPQDLKDCLFPRTGKLRPDGSEDRVSLPSYMKDIGEYAHDIHGAVAYGDNPFHTVTNKLHPLLATIAELVTNKDFFDGAIRSPGDSAFQQAKDVGGFLAGQFAPFSIRNFQQQQKNADAPPIENVGDFINAAGQYVTSPQMIGVSPSPGYITQSDEQQQNNQVAKMRNSLIMKFKEDMRNGADWADIAQRVRDAGLSPQDAAYIRRSAVQRPPKRFKSFADN